MGETVLAASEGADFLTNLTSIGSSILELAISTGTKLLSLQIVQIFIAVTIVGTCIGLISRGIHSLRS